MNNRDPYGYRPRPDNQNQGWQNENWQEGEGQQEAYADPYAGQYTEQYEGQYKEQNEAQHEQQYGGQYEEQQYAEQYEDANQQPYADPYSGQRARSGNPASEPAYDPHAYGQQEYEDYEEPVRPARAPRAKPKPTVISTNATINLTSTIGAFSGLFGLFLYFADKKSRAVRRFAVQSAGLFCITAFVTIALALLAALFGFIPLIGLVLGGLIWVAVLALLSWSLYQRVQLMLHAYRGEAYVVPVIGRHFRQFE